MRRRNIVYEDKSKSDKLNAAIRLLTELEEGELSACKREWMDYSRRSRNNIRIFIKEILVIRSICIGKIFRHSLECMRGRSNLICCLI